MYIYKNQSLALYTQDPFQKYSNSPRTSKRSGLSCLCQSGKRHFHLEAQTQLTCKSGRISSAVGIVRLSKLVKKSRRDFIDVIMKRTLEQRFAVIFCVEPNKTFSETLTMLKEAYGGRMSRTQVYRVQRKSKSMVEINIFLFSKLINWHIVHKDFAPQGTTVNSMYCKEVFERLS